MKAAWKLLKDTIPEAQTICTAFTKNFRKTKKNPDCLNYLSNSHKEASKSRTASFEKLTHPNKKNRKDFEKLKHPNKKNRKEFIHWMVRN